MSQDDIKQLKVNLMRARQQLSQYQQQNTELRNKCSEWYEWSQKIQQTLQEKDNIIQSLKQQVETYRKEKEAREESIGNRTIEDLYEENQNLEIESREYKHYTQKMAKLLYDLLIKKNLSTQETERIVDILSKCKIDDSHILIFALLLKEKKAMDTMSIAKKLNLPSSEIKRNIEKLLSTDQITQIGNSAYTAERNVITTDNYDTASINDVLKSIQIRLNTAKTIVQACDILEDFSTAVNRQNYTVIASEIGRKSAEIRRNKFDYQLKDITELFQHWKNELTPKKRIRSDTQKQLVPDQLATLPNIDIITDIKNALNDARSTNDLLNILNIFIEALRIKGGHGMLIMKVRNFIDHNKEAKLINKSICLNKLEEWEDRFIH